MNSHHRRFRPFKKTPPPPQLPIRVRDRFARILEIGDTCLAPSDGIHTEFQLMEVTPILDPKAPPNMVQAIWSGQIIYQGPADAPLESMVRIRTKAEMPERVAGEKKEESEA